jgi:hypothetical protein
MGDRDSFRVRPSIHLRLATADRLRDRTCPNSILLKRTLSSSPTWRRRIEGCGKKVEKYKNIVMYFSHPPLTESDTRQSRQALSSLEGGNIA